VLNFALPFWAGLTLVHPARWLASLQYNQQIKKSVQAGTSVTARQPILLDTDCQRFACQLFWEVISL
jgi:hypothetical protein